MVRFQVPQKSAFLASWTLDLSPGVIQKFSTPQLHDYMCQTSSCQISEEDGCGVDFFLFFTEKRTELVLNNIRTFLTSQVRKNIVLWQGTLKPNLVLIQKAVSELQPQERMLTVLLWMGRLTAKHTAISVNSGLIYSLLCRLNSGMIFHMMTEG